MNPLAIKIGTILKHYKGGVYEVYDLTNEGSVKEDFPPMASYRDGDGNKYSRSIDTLVNSGKYEILDAKSVHYPAHPEL